MRPAAKDCATGRRARIQYLCVTTIITENRRSNPIRTADSALRVVVDDDELRVCYLPGAHDRMVIACTGIGHGMGQVQQDEFMGTCSRGGSNHVVFLRDVRRSWFTTPGLIPRIVNVVNELAASAEISKVAIIGNSMGAYGAVLLPKYIDTDVSIAFSPQASMDPSVVKDDRWKEFRPFIHNPPVRVVSDAIVPNTKYYVIHGMVGTDIRHVRLFPEIDNLAHFVIPGLDHHVSAYLKDHGLLGPLVHAMLDGDDAAVETLIGRVHGIRNWSKAYTAALRRQKRNPAWLLKYTGRRLEELLDVVRRR